MLTLYTHPMSPCAQKVRILLADKGIEAEKRHVDLPGKENLQPWYLALNPLGVVPTLVEDERPVIESSIICEYLEDRYPEPPMRPEDPWWRARMRYWMKHVDNKVHPACGALQWPLVMRPGFMEKPEAERERLLEQIPEKPRRERQRRLVQMGLDAPDVADAARVYAATIEQMDADLARKPWLAGDACSLADIAMAPYFQTLYQFGWTELFEAREAVADWYARISARPSYQAGVAADFPPQKLADLRQRGEPALEKIRSHLAA